MSGAGSEMGCTCQLCGTIYRVDILIPDELWVRIAGENKRLLCGSCIADCIEGLNEFAAYRLVPVTTLQSTGAP